MQRTYRFFELGITCLSMVSLLFFTSYGEEKVKANAPAKVISGVKEDALNKVQLTSEAETRLGVQTSIVERKMIPKTLKASGEIISPPGQDVKVEAPVAGTVVGTSGSHMPAAGSFVKKGQQIMRLLVMPAEKDAMAAKEEVNVKQVEYETMLSSAKRFQQLRNDKAISEKAFEEMQAQLAKAESALNMAKARLQQLQSSDVESVANNLSALAIYSPLSGILQNVFVASGQTVPASAVLFEVTCVDPVWVRVPVFSGDMSKIDLEQKATVVVGNGDEGDVSTFFGTVTNGPQRSDNSNSSSYLYYVLDNKSDAFRIGQRVRVVLTQRNMSQNLVVPFNSVVYDINGGNWVYVKVGQQAYSRRRVELSHVANDLAIVTRGVKPGDEVVTNGVAEIFGTEFGGGK